MRKLNIGKGRKKTSDFAGFKEVSLKLKLDHWKEIHYMWRSEKMQTVKKKTMDISSSMEVSKGMKQDYLKHKQ